MAVSQSIGVGNGTGYNTLDSTPSDYEDIPFSAELFQYAVAIAFILIALLGLSGNSLVLYVIAKHNDMKTVTNYFIASLAVTDIALLLICDIPTTMMFLNWQIQSQFVCRTMSYMQSVTVQATCLTLTVMTIDRYNLIVHAVKSRNTRTTFRAVVINSLIWAFSFIIHIPAFVGTRMNEKTGFCEREFNNPSGKIYHYVIANIFLMYLLPLTIIVYCYIQILVQVWRKTSEGTESAQAQARALRRKKRITKMVAIVVILFAICYAPLHICLLAILVYEVQGKVPTALMNYLHILVLVLAYTNSALNPFVYAFATTSFKKYFRRVFSSCTCSRVGGEMMTSVSISMKTKTERLSVTQNGPSKDDSSI